MRYKGTYDPTATYDVGDVVIFENGVVYHLQKPAVAGTAPTDTRYWGQLEQNLSDAVKIVGNAGGGGGGGGGTFIFSASESTPSGTVFTTTFREIVDALEQGEIVIYRYKEYGSNGYIQNLSDAILTEIAKGTNYWKLRFLCYDLPSDEYTPIQLMADDYDNPIKESDLS